eukprot:9823438-Prorocentrum_lima.AAC.1
MTSSLVGSEMCIRDRCWHLCFRYAPRVTMVSCPCARLPPFPVGHHVPVSYTHLTLPTICSV